jgi:hypothetical protein
MKVNPDLRKNKDMKSSRRHSGALAEQASPESAESIRRALMGLGVEFIEQNGGGPGVRLRERQRQKKTK